MSKPEVVIKEIDTVYDYNDFPLNFIFTREDKDGVFYAHWVDSDKNDNPIFWVNEVTKALVKKAEKREITIRELLTNHTLKTVELWTCSVGTDELPLNEAEKRYKEDLPDEDGYLLD